MAAAPASAADDLNFSKHVLREAMTALRLSVNSTDSLAKCNLNAFQAFQISFHCCLFHSLIMFPFSCIRHISGVLAVS